MAVTFADYIQYIKTATTLKPRVRFEFLNPDETIMTAFSAELTSGSLSANRANGVRRTCNINVHNVYDQFTPNPTSFWVNQKFKLYLGYNINGEDFFLPQGVFGVSDPDVIHYRGQKEATISGIDKFGFLNGTIGGRIYSTYYIPVNSNVVSVLKALLVDANINDPQAPMLMINSALTTPNAITESYGQNYSNLLSDINDQLAYNMYYNNNGRFVCEPDVLNSIKAVSWEFSTNNNKFLKIDSKFNFGEAYNVVMVVGDNIEGNLASAIAKNSDPSSPLSTLRIGEKVAPIITSSVISTDAQAQDRANYELMRYARMGINSSIDCVPLIHLDVDQIVTVTDNYLNLNAERFLINSFDISFSPNNSTMTLTATKANDLDFEITET